MRVALNATLVTDGPGAPFVELTFPASDGSGDVEVARITTTVKASDPKLPEANA